jgi:Protein of unknown function (DUF1553)/Protein of unknown function (DUF1549)/Planctomycete cytochrome C
MINFHSVIAFLCVIVFTIGSAPADEPVDYVMQIKPILAAKCCSCHGALNQESDLRLETGALMLQGGDSGAVIVAGEPNKSLLLERISAAEDQRMPPAEDGAPLDAEQIALIRKWISEGAKFPPEDVPLDPRQHWAFQKPVRPEVPRVEDPDWSQNPIDAFLAVRHVDLNLIPVEVAEKHILLRRIYLDLIGLPPTRDQLRVFLEDDSNEAWENIVDDLLKSPRHGERWGRHWMDVWRYSDWYGLGKEVRSSQRHIWRWRDWIVQSLNEDKSYRRMIVEMLAGDEISPLDPDTVRATGFLARNWWVFNRDKQLDDTIEHTSKAFLGLTLNCAKCHDHKYDPVTQVDYYRMRAFFEPYQARLDPVNGEVNLERDGLPRVFDAYPNAPTYVFIRGNDKDPDKSTVIEPGVPVVFSNSDLNITEVALPPEAINPAIQSFVIEDHLRDAASKIQAAAADVEKATQQVSTAEQAAAATLALDVAEKTLAAAECQPAALRSAHAADVAKAGLTSSSNVTQLVSDAAVAARTYELALAEAALARATQQLTTADDKKKAEATKKVATAKTNLEKAQKAFEQPGEKYTSLRVSVQAANGYGEHVAGTSARQGPFTKISTGRRTALAHWIASPDNPLTARVAVNHLWLRHFGQPLVESVSDFGLRAKRPVQHDLLDWLAVELMENDWSMKHLHRLIVTSRAYKARSMLHGADETTQAIDPGNDYYWRRNPQRLQSQVIRDSLLFLAGALDLSVGGPTIDPAKENTIYRRSLYFTHSRDRRAKFLSTFDDADVMQCYRRGDSIIPQQALALANSELALTMSRSISTVLQETLGDATDEQFINAAFETVLLIRPTADEVAACRELLNETKSVLVSDKHATPTARARENLVHALLNHNDFVTVR